jgi:hypothetical protein
VRPVCGGATRGLPKVSSVNTFKIRAASTLHAQIATLQFAATIMPKTTESLQLLKENFVLVER